LSGWSNTENNREAKYYAITKAGLKGLEEETARWRQMSGVVEKLLVEEP
jgi:PadR family transcriptional regulator, regulatory protein PadR